MFIKGELLAWNANRVACNAEELLSVIESQPLFSSKDENGDRCIQEKVKVALGSVIYKLNFYAATGKPTYVECAVAIYEGISDDAFLDCFFATPNDQAGRIANRDRMAVCRDLLKEKKKILDSFKQPNV